MINSAQNYPISSILDIEANVKFVIPKYQREYTWGRGHWENLFDDVWDNFAGHFLGSIICINRSEDALRTQALELVDGQQRLMTLSLLYAAIYKRITDHGNLDEDTTHELYNLKHRLILKSGPKGLRVEPSYQNRNFQDYEFTMETAGILKNVEKPPNLGNRRVHQAYRYFEERLEDLRTKDNLLRLIKKVNSASVVKIEVASHSDAFTLFESLNNRGMPLSALDLIKNKLLAVLERQQPNSIDDNFKQWTRLLENLTDEYSVQERYLRQYYNAFKYKQEVGVPRISLATRSNIINVYEHLIDKDAKAIFADLYEKARLYNRIIAPNDDSIPKELADQFKELERIGGAPAYTLLLYLLAERPTADLPGISEFLVKFFVRRNLTDQPPTRDLARNFITVIDALRRNDGRDPLSVIHQEFQNQGWIAPDEIFRSKLEGSIYEENVDATRFVLCKIEESHQTRETFTDLWKRNSRGDYIWTVEHIFPQGANIPESWVKMIAGGDEAKAKDIREQYVHKLGNLTITGYNSKLGNKSFAEKRDRTDNNGMHVGYKNGLYLNNELRSKDSWNIEDIRRRTELLVDEALKLFSI